MSIEELPTIEGLGEKASQIAKFIAEMKGLSVPMLRPPWARLGWHQTALAWIDQELEKMGRKLLGRPEAKSV